MFAIFAARRERALTGDGRIVFDAIWDDGGALLGLTGEKPPPRHLWASLPSPLSPAANAEPSPT